MNKLVKNNIDGLRFSEVIKTVELADAQKSPASLNVFFLSNIVIQPLVTCLKYLCYQDGIKPRVHVSNYDSVMQEVMDAQSDFYKHQPDIAIICLHIKNLSEKLYVSFSTLMPEEVEKEKIRILELMEEIVREIRQKTSAAVLMHNFDIPVYPNSGILDYQSCTAQLNSIRQINQELVKIANRYDGIYIVDVDLLKTILGNFNFVDNRYWHIGKAPYSREAYKIIANEYIKFIRALKGRNKKCLILDCDNVLWGGILGEDGLNKIAIGTAYPGSAYREFQQAVLNLHNRGVLLAICSKNNENDVLEVLDRHPDMLLRRNHFVSLRINWTDKVTNIKAVAQQLNIGLDSIVFMDDSEFEINLVRQVLPEVKVIQLPKDPCQYSDLISSCGFFDTLVFSEEDKKRSKMYQAENRRKQAKEGFKNRDLKDYLGYLEMELLIKKIDDFSLPRIVQLTQRTNQFNLTTKRYLEKDIKNFSSCAYTEIFSAQLKDRFGDYGIIGAAILRYGELDAVIDTFLLSCRVIGRGIEEVLLKFCVEAAIKRECKNLTGIYVPTKNNSLVKDFYCTHKFSYMGNNGDGLKFIFHLGKDNLEFPSYFKSIITPDLGVR